MTDLQSPDARIDTKPKDLSGFQRDILAALGTMGSTYGIAIQEHLTEEFGYGEVLHGRFYPNVDRLSDRGLIEKRENHPDDRSNTYSLTGEGQLLLEQLARRYAGATP